MTYVLIDNATLTGVQRLVGQVPTRSERAVEADIGAMENLVEAILLYDQVVAIDDYKPEFRDARREAFPFVRFLDPKEYGLPAVADAAAAAAQAVRPVVRGGDFADADFKSFFEELRTHVVAEWNMQSSVFFLNLRLLGESRGEEFEKYGALSQAIYSELSDSARAGGRPVARALLLDSQGRPIDADYTVDGGGRRPAETKVSPALMAFLASLNWLAHRTIYYALAAEHLRGDVALYPTRQVYHRNYMARTGRLEGSFVAEVAELLAKETRDAASEIISANRATAVSLSLPIFSAWLVQKTGDVREVVGAALELKDDARVVRTRDQLKELRVLFEDEDTEAASRKVQKLRSELQRGLDEVRRAFGLKMTHTMTWATVVKTYNAVKGDLWPGLPEIGEQTPVLPERIRQRRQAGVGALYRDVGRDLAQFPKLGQTRDLLGKAVRIRKDAYSATPLAVAPAFRYARPSWKRPM